MQPAKMHLVGLMLLGLAPLVSAEDAPTVTTKTLSAGTANQLASAAYQACAELGFHVTVAVVGRDGLPLALLRSPSAGPHSIEVAQRKGYAANTFRAPTAALAGRDFMRDIPGVLLIPGGIPVSAAGQHVGAVGVSGAPGQQSPGDVDIQCAEAGIEAVQTDLDMDG